MRSTEEGFVDMVEDDFFRLVANARNPDRLFAVRSNKNKLFYTGSCSGGLQALVGRWYTEHILVLLFSREGYLRDICRQELPQFRLPPEQLYHDINDGEFHELLRAEYGFEAGMVRVRQFMVQDENCVFSVGPLGWGDHQTIAEMLASPEGLADQGWDQARELICEFINRGLHIIDWANEWRMLDTEGRDAG
jgi:hypothetical protein